MSITHLDGSTTDRPAYRQVTLELTHPGCWTLDVTREHHNTHLIEKSLYPTADCIKGDFVLISEGDVAVDTVVRTIDDHPAVDDVAVIRQFGDRARVVVNYCRESSIVPDIVNAEFMPIEPVHITGGTEFWTVLVPESTLSEVVERLRRDYDVSIRTIEAVDPADGLGFADVVDRTHDALSDRQRECLLHAREQGYYRWPRDLPATEVAADLGVSGPTLLEHLRKGEQKILNTVLDELQDRHRSG